MAAVPNQVALRDLVVGQRYKLPANFDENTDAGPRIHRDIIESLKNRYHTLNAKHRYQNPGDTEEHYGLGFEVDAQDRQIRIDHIILWSQFLTHRANQLFDIVPPESTSAPGAGASRKNRKRTNRKNRKNRKSMCRRRK